MFEQQPKPPNTSEKQDKKTSKTEQDPENTKDLESDQAVVSTKGPESNEKLGQPSKEWSQENTRAAEWAPLHESIEDSESTKGEEGITPGEQAQQKHAEQVEARLGEPDEEPSAQFVHPADNQKHFAGPTKDVSEARVYAERAAKACEDQKRRLKEAQTTKDDELRGSYRTERGWWGIPGTGGTEDMLERQAKYTREQYDSLFAHNKYKEKADEIARTWKDCNYNIAGMVGRPFEFAWVRARQEQKSFDAWISRANLHNEKHNKNAKQWVVRQGLRIPSAVSGLAVALPVLVTAAAVAIPTVFWGMWKLYQKARQDSTYNTIDSFLK